jgi:CubicO group peptidase (beta-lactamase class C family)
MVLLSCLPAWAESASSDPRPNEVNAIFKEFDRKDSPGCSLAVIKKNKLIYEHGYGMADLDYNIPLTPSSEFYLASMSKQFTAFSVALLIEQGKVGLNDPLIKYFPELPSGVYGPVTVASLLHHTSGIRDFFTLLELEGKSTDDHFSYADFLALLERQKELNFKPGDRYLYSNSGYVLLGMLVQRVSGDRLSEFAAKNIFRPLGMMHTFFHDDPQTIIKNRATGYDFEGGSYKFHPTNFSLVGDGGLISTVEDLTLWNENFYKNGLGKGSQDLISMIETPGEFNNGKPQTYAFGLEVQGYKGLRSVGHSGFAFGYRTDMVRFPSEKLSVIALCNTDSSRMVPAILTRRVADLYLAGEIPKGGAFETKPTDATQNRQALDRFAGIYEEATSGTVWTIAVRDGVLTAVNGGAKFSLAPLSSTHFRSTDSAVDADLEFAPADREKAESIKAVVNFQPKMNLQRLALAAIGPEKLKNYIGEYFSDELGVPVRIVARDGKLYYSLGHEARKELRPLSTDNFDSGSQRLTFIHDSSGRVVRFRLDAGRVSNMLFVRR